MEKDELALAETVADGSGETTRGAGPTLPHAPERAGSPSITLESSVLPKVDLVDGEPRLIREDRARFELLDKVGEGGAGEVLRAHDTDIGRDVAIKRLRDARSEMSLARFVEEMRVTGSLDHPNVVPVHDVGVAGDGDYFFVMRHVEGDTLAQIIDRLAAGDPETHRQFGIERRVDIFRDILEAVAYAHARGVVHRDLKPANIMVGPFGEVMVMDWGVAKPVGRKDLATLGQDGEVTEEEGLERAFETQQGALVGTPAYMAPEQVRGLPVDERTDVYALCVMLHEMLYLRHYLADETNLVGICNGVVNTDIEHHFRTGIPAQPTVPTDLLWVIERGMKKEPDERYQSVQEILDELARRNEGDIVVQCAFTFTRRLLYRTLSFYDRHPIAFIGGVITIVVVVIAALVIGFAT